MGRGGKRPGAGRPRKDAIRETKVKKTGQNEQRAFTEEEVFILKQSPFIRKVTAKTITYTVEFKEMFWNLYNQGMSPPQIFEQAGIDMGIVGETRAYGILTMLRKAKEHGISFTDGQQPIQPAVERVKLPRLPIGKRFEEVEVNAVEFRKLQHQVLFLSQQMEFLKKIMTLETKERSP